MGESIVREEQESSYGAMVTLILKCWDDATIMRNEKRKKTKKWPGRGEESRENVVSWKPSEECFSKQRSWSAVSDAAGRRIKMNTEN